MHMIESSYSPPPSAASKLILGLSSRIYAWQIDRESSPCVGLK